MKNHTYSSLDVIISIKHFDPNNIKIDERSYKNILIYYIRYMTIKDLKYGQIKCFIAYFQQGEWVL